MTAGTIAVPSKADSLSSPIAFSQQVTAYKGKMLQSLFCVKKVLLEQSLNLEPLDSGVYVKHTRFIEDDCRENVVVCNRADNQVISSTSASDFK